MNYETILKDIRVRLRFIAEASLDDEALNIEFNELQLMQSSILRILKGIKND